MIASDIKVYRRYKGQYFYDVRKTANHNEIPKEFLCVINSLIVRLHAYSLTTSYSQYNQVKVDI